MEVSKRKEWRAAEVTGWSGGAGGPGRRAARPTGAAERQWAACLRRSVRGQRGARARGRGRGSFPCSPSGAQLGAAPAPSALGQRLLTPAESEAGVRSPRVSLAFSLNSPRPPQPLLSVELRLPRQGAARRRTRGAPPASRDAPASECAPAGTGTEARSPAAGWPCAAQTEAVAELLAWMRPVFCVLPDPRAGARPGRGAGVGRAEATLWLLAPPLAPRSFGISLPRTRAQVSAYAPLLGPVGFRWAAAGPPCRPLARFLLRYSIFNSGC